MSSLGASYDLVKFIYFFNHSGTFLSRTFLSLREVCSEVRVSICLYNGREPMGQTVSPHYLKGLMFAVWRCYNFVCFRRWSGNLLLPILFSPDAAYKDSRRGSGRTVAAGTITYLRFLFLVVEKRIFMVNGLFEAIIGSAGRRVHQPTLRHVEFHDKYCWPVCGVQKCMKIPALGGMATCLATWNRELFNSVSLV